MMDRFSLEVETMYFNDPGNQNNVFNLNAEDLKNRIVDMMDFVKDPISSNDYCPEEDPKLYRSQKTGRGPLNEDWVNECVRTGKPVMCAYKMCRVEFRYWGLQTRAERWIHDLALRNTMLRAHRQAWAWQDEWVGLTMTDIRRWKLKQLNISQPNDEAAEDSDASSDNLYFDCSDGTSLNHKPSIIRWSSELELEIVDEHSPPLTPHGPNGAALLIMVFHGEFSLDNPVDARTNDTNTFSRSTIDSLVQRHYPQLRGRVHVLMVSCGSELDPVVNRLSSISSSFGALHPSMALIISSAQSHYHDAIEGTIRRANEAYTEFVESQPQFNGEVFVVGDTLGGLLLYEALTKYDVKTRVTNCNSRTSIGETDGMSNHIYPSLHPEPVIQKSPSIKSANARISPALLPQAASKKKASLGSASIDSVMVQTRIIFQPSTAFLLGCPLGLVLTQRKLLGYDIDPLEVCQVFNLYYPLDPCGARLEPVLNPHLSLLQPANIPAVPRGRRSPLYTLIPRSISHLYGVANVWIMLSIVLQQWLLSPHLRYRIFYMHPIGNHWTLLRSYFGSSSEVKSQSLPPFCQPQSSAAEDRVTTAAMEKEKNSFQDIDPLEVCQVFNLYYPLDPCGARLEPVLNPHLSLLQPANVPRYQRYPVGDGRPIYFDSSVDLTPLWGSKRMDHALYCPTGFLPYGTMDLVALTREQVSVFLCPQRGDWYEVGVFEVDSHGRLLVSLGMSLPCGIHSLKMVVHGDRSYLDSFVAVVPSTTRCVVFSVDGSLTASVSVTGKDPRVRPGAVDVVRYWFEQGQLILYLTARPDMQQRVVSAWLAQHCFPHGLLLFNPSFSTDPLKQKSLHLKHITDMGIRIHAAYGSSKDVAVYCGAGVDPKRIVSVSGARRRACIAIGK
ncbi:DDHD domain protein, partial [Ostertagia ostertagi]